MKRLGLLFAALWLAGSAAADVSMSIPSKIAGVDAAIVPSLAATPETVSQIVSQIKAINGGPQIDLSVERYGDSQAENPRERYNITTPMKVLGVLGIHRKASPDELPTLLQKNRPVHVVQETQTDYLIRSRSWTNVETGAVYKKDYSREESPIEVKTSHSDARILHSVQDLVKWAAERRLISTP